MSTEAAYGRGEHAPGNQAASRDPHSYGHAGDPSEAAAPPALLVEDLGVGLEDGTPIVQEVSFALERGDVLGIVGESGSGKTTTALALLGYTAEGVEISSGSIAIAGQQLLGRSTRSLRRLRGKLISYVPQDPSSSLNPARRVGAAIEAMLDLHAGGSGHAERARHSLGQMQLPNTREFARRFPHQLSGGQQQRVAIAIAIVCEPPIVVLDEPTTGLDVITQAHILEEVDRLRSERGIGLVYVSHDLSVVAQVADRIAVMYAGRVVEEGPVDEVLRAPRHPYTRGLVAAVPDAKVSRQPRGIPGVSVGVGERPPGCPFAPRCALRVDACEAAVPALEVVTYRHRARCIRWRDSTRIEVAATRQVVSRAGSQRLLEVKGLCADYREGRTSTRVVHDVDMHIEKGECVALIGESGSGKTTIARCVAGLHRPSAGTMIFDEAPLAPVAAKRSREIRGRIQFVFQNATDSLNPRHRVREEVARPLRVLRGLSRREAESRVAQLLERVSLPQRLANHFPGELSGGERQRVAVARALAADPELMICDEITSALDVSVQAAVLELLEELREQLGLAMLFITHDLGVVSSIADRGLVLHHGHVCEQGPVRELLDHPQHEYTKALLNAVPTLAGTLDEVAGAGPASPGI